MVRMSYCTTSTTNMSETAWTPPKLFCDRLLVPPRWLPPIPDRNIVHRRVYITQQFLDESLPAVDGIFTTRFCAF